jgi:hypothetical protein
MQEEEAALIAGLVLASAQDFAPLTVHRETSG